MKRKIHKNIWNMYESTHLLMFISECDFSFDLLCDIFHENWFNIKTFWKYEIRTSSTISLRINEVAIIFRVHKLYNFLTTEKALLKE
jgi:hypothetical protein